MTIKRYFKNVDENLEVPYMHIELKTLDPRFLEEFGAPVIASDGAAGVDLRVNLRTSGKINSGYVLESGEAALFHTGTSIHIAHPGYAGFVFIRSHVAASGIQLHNSVGVIDSDYQGEIKLLLANISPNAQTLHHGDRVAQLVIMPVVTPIFNIVDQFSSVSKRSTGGFGSTGDK